MIKVLTFNVLHWNLTHPWKKRKAKVIDILRQSQADIFCLQEVKRKQLVDISNAFRSHYSFYYKARDGKDGEGCPIFYNLNKYSVLDYDTFWFSNTPHKKSRGWGDIVPRICSWVQLMSRSTGQTFYVYNVHLTCLGTSGKKKSVNLLVNTMQSPYILAGDFNSPFESMQMGAFKYMWHSKQDKKNIDHIIASHENFTMPDSYVIESGKASDHNCVVATVEKKGKVTNETIDLL